MPDWVGEVLLPVWDSLVRQMLGLLDLNGRLGLAFLWYRDWETIIISPFSSQTFSMSS